MLLAGMQKRKWEIAPADSAAEELAGKLKISPIIAQVLINRRIHEAERARSFLSPKLTELIEPENMPGAEGAAARVKRAHLQHSYLDIDRAVENRVPFVRCGNSGTTCIIDPYGRITGSLPVLEPGHLTERIMEYPKKGPTLYTRFGNWFPVLCLIVSMLFFCLAGIYLAYEKA